jgi:UDP-glucose 4-epimerase
LVRRRLGSILPPGIFTTGFRSTSRSSKFNPRFPIDSVTLIVLPVKKPVVITGGAGFIGSHLVERILADGHPVCVIDDLSTGSLANLSSVLRHPGLTLRQGKVSAQPDLIELVSNADSVVHLAAAVGVELVIHSPIQTMETNLRETEAILAAAAPCRIPVLLASTSEVYGKSQKPRFAESDDLLIGPPHLGRWSYACSKLMDEFLALAYQREHGVPVTVVRFFNTVGPRQTGRHGMVLPRFIAAARCGEPLRVYGDGEQTRCFCLVDDAVEAAVRLRATPAAIGQVVNVGNDEAITVLELARLVIQLLGSKSALELIPYDQAYSAGFEDMRHRRPALERLQELTGFRPRRGLEEIIRATAGI